jgi:hypothetical protein
VRAGIAGGVHHRLDAAKLRRRRDRAHLRLGLHRITQADARGPRHEPAHQFVVDRALDQQARAGDASLAAGGEDPGQNAGLSGVELRVGKDDVRALAPELERVAPEARADGLRDRAAGGAAAGERDLGDAGVLDERRAGAVNRHGSHAGTI